MEREAKKRHLSFLTSKARAQQFYALDINDDDFIEMAYDAWRAIGNIATKVDRYFVKVPADFIIEIPKQVEFVQSVTLVDQREVITSFDSSGARDRTVSAYQEKSNLPDLNQSITTSPGKTINYIVEGPNAIKITSVDAADKDIMVVYRTIDLDEDGLPLLNDKEVAAISAEVARRVMIRKSFQGVGLKNKTDMALLQMISGEAERLMAAAKIDEKITDDAIDKMLDIRTSWNRKVYGRRFNMID